MVVSALIHLHIVYRRSLQNFSLPFALLCKSDTSQRWLKDELHKYQHYHIAVHVDQSVFIM